MASILGQALAGHPAWQPLRAAQPFGGNRGLQNAAGRQSPAGNGLYGGNLGLRHAAAMPYGGNMGLAAAMNRPQEVGNGAYGGNRGLQAAAIRPQELGDGTYGGNLGLQHAAGGVPPAVPAAGGDSGGGAPGQTGPLDATYNANVAANQFRTNNAIDGLNLQGAHALTSLQSTLAQLAYQQPRSELALEQRANQNGSLLSSVYGQNLGNLQYQFLGKQGAAQDNYANAMDSIAAKIAGLQGEESLYEAQQAAASTARATAAAAKDPSQGQGTGGLSIPGVAPPAHAAPSGQPTRPDVNHAANLRLLAAAHKNAARQQRQTLAGRLARKTGP